MAKKKIFSLTSIPSKEYSGAQSSTPLIDTTDLSHQQDVPNVSHVVYHPEIDNGNIEYKWRLLNVTEDRLHHLATQMKFRLEEGNGEALYCLGVTDNGIPLGLPKSQMDETIETIQKVASRIGAILSIYQTFDATNGKIYEIYITCPILSYLHCKETRVVVVGAVESGKSSLIGSLISGILDNGNGLSRLRVFRHRHELLLGRTSSMSCHSICFNSTGSVMSLRPSDNVLYHPSEDTDVIQRCSHLVTLIDLAGSQCYSKSTYKGLCHSFPDCFLIIHRIVPKSHILMDHPMRCLTDDHLLKTKQYIMMGCIFKCPIILAFTAVDTIPLYDQENEQQQIYQFCYDHHIPIMMYSTNLSLKSCLMSQNFNQDQEHFPVVMIVTSAVTGQGLQSLRSLLYTIPIHTPWLSSNIQVPIFIVEKFFTNINGIDLVVGGILLTGTFDILHSFSIVCGPFHQYSLNKHTSSFQRPLSTTSHLWIPLQIQSLHTHRIPVKIVFSGQRCSIGLTWDKSVFNTLPSFHPGLILIGSETLASQLTCRQTFLLLTLLPGSNDVRITIVSSDYHSVHNELLHNDSISSYYPYTLFLHTARQQIGISRIFNYEQRLRSECTSLVEIQFAYHPEFIIPEIPFLLTGIGIKGCGVVQSINTTHSRSSTF